MKKIFFFFIILFLSNPVVAQDGYLKTPAKKAVLLSETRVKLESDNLDSMIMRLQELEQQVQAMTNDFETVTRNLDKITERLEKINTDNDLRFKDIEQKSIKTEQDIKSIQDEKKQAELAQQEALKKQKQAEIAKAKADKEKGAKAKTEFGKMTPKQLYDTAFAALKKPDYKTAEKQFEAFLSLYPKDTLAGNAQYWLGESYYARGNYEDAAIAFANGFKNYRQSQKAPDNLLKLGLTMAQLKKKEEACIAFKNFTKEYPKVSESMKKRIENEAKKIACR